VFLIPSRVGGGGVRGCLPVFLRGASVRGSLEMHTGTGQLNTGDSPTVLVLSVSAGENQRRVVAVGRQDFVGEAGGRGSVF
jgi:hypothetical protein